MNRDESKIGIRRTSLHLGQHSVVTQHGDFVIHFFRDLAGGQLSMAIVCGRLDGSSPVLARVHSSCVTSECLMGCDCDCAEQLNGALAAMARAGEGVLFYLMQEGRGAGLTAKARDRMIVQASENQITTFEAYAQMGLPPDLRRYEAVAAMSRLLDIAAPLRLLTNNPDKAAAVAKVLAEEEIEVCGTEPILGSSSVFNDHYLGAKQESGHALNRAFRLETAPPPQPVKNLPPLVLPGESNQIRTASYFLPIALPNEDDSRRVEWFRLSVILDRETARESIVLADPRTSVADGRAEASAIVEGDGPITMSLIDRLPVANAEGREVLTRILLSICKERRGAVAVSFDDRDLAER